MYFGQVISHVWGNNSDDVLLYEPSRPSTNISNCCRGSEAGDMSLCETIQLHNLKEWQALRLKSRVARWIGAMLRIRMVQNIPDNHDDYSVFLFAR